jgi:hypothetical protein
MGEMRNADNVLVRNPEEKISLGRLRWEDDIKTYLRVIRLEGVD